MSSRWVLITALLMVSGCANTDPSGTVAREHGETHGVDDSILPPKFNLGDVVAVGEDIAIGIIVRSYRQWVDDAQVWVYQVMFHNQTIKYTESKIVLVEKFDWNRPAKKGIID